MSSYRNNPLRTRRISPPPTNLTLKGAADLRRRGSARKRYQTRRGAGGRNSFRALAGWFLLGAVAAVIFVAILTPLTIRSLPAQWVDRLPPALKCLHPNFCRNEILPTAAAQVDAASLLLGESESSSGSGGSAQAAALAPTAIETAAWTVSTTAPTVETPTLMPSNTPTELQPEGLPPTPQASPTAAAIDYNTPVPTPVIALTPTAQSEGPPPTETPAAVAMSEPASRSAEVTLPPASQLHGFRHITQTWNNCGPATLAMGLVYWSWNGTQAEAARVLKPNPNDKNVTPEQMVAFVNEDVPGLKAVARHAGDAALIKRLVVSGYPVIIETGFAPDGYDWMGHYRLVVGYSDQDASFYLYDSFLGDGGGQGIRQSYDLVDRLWQQFNRVYVVVYPQAQEAQVRGLLGDHWDEALNAEHALRAAKYEAQLDRGNAFVWFNLGTSYVLNGQYEQAAIAYDEARNLGLPWRMLWYQFGPFEAYLNTNRLDDVIALALANHHNTEEVEETYYYWGLALAQRGEHREARQKFQQALNINRNFEPATAALQALPQ